MLNTLQGRPDAPVDHGASFSPHRDSFPRELLQFLDVAFPYTSDNNEYVERVRRSCRQGLARSKMARDEAFTCRSRNPSEAHAEPQRLQTRLGEEAARGVREARLVELLLQEGPEISTPVWAKQPSRFGIKLYHPLIYLII